MLKIQIKREKSQSAHAILMALAYAQGSIADVLYREPNKDAHTTLLALHADELYRVFNKLEGKGQKQYTITLTDVQAEAYRQIWGRVKLAYDTYGAVHVQNLLDEINKALKRTDVKFEVKNGSLGAPPTPPPDYREHFGVL